MGYTTDFSGSLLLSRPATTDEKQFINAFSQEGKCQTGLWCNWELDDTGTELKWNGGEKFYNYIEWLEYLIQHFFTPWNIKLNGKIKWNGEDSDDVGLITVKNNKVTYKEGTIVYK